MKKLAGHSILKVVGFIVLAIFFLLAGINHFRDPEFYFPLIPHYLPYPELINTTAGIAEIGLGIGILIPGIRKIAIYLIIVMLIAFIPSHIYFIQLDGCIQEGLCVPVWLAWVRLIIIHPLLILWVWSYRNFNVYY